MTWNYRWVAVDRDGETEVGLYEVYYNEDGEPISRTENPATFVGDTVGEALDALNYATQADATVLDDALFQREGTHTEKGDR